MDDLAELVMARTGLGFGPMGRVRLNRAASARIETLRLEGPAAYLAYLRGDDTEWSRLVPRLVDGHTSFNRNPAQWAALRELLADLTMRRQERRLVMLSAGCSTGEEALSLALTAWDIGLLNKNWDVTVLAADLNPKAIETLRTAAYPAETLDQLPDRTVSRWFRAKGGRFQAKPDLAEIVQPAVFNLLENDLWPWPDQPEQVDVVFVKNVLLSLEPAACRQITQRLAGLTAPDGLLFTGPTEGLPFGSADFAPERWGGVVYLRRLSTQVKVNPGHQSRKARRRAEGSGRSRPAPATPVRLSKKTRKDMWRAVESLKGDYPEEAFPQLEKILDAAADRGELLTPAIGLAARVHAAIGRHAEARDLAARINRLEAQTPWAHVIIGDAFRAEGETDAARRAYKLSASLLAFDENWAKDPYYRFDPVYEGYETPSDLITARLNDL